jgi:exopolysaccharide biosynthesis operon protein EpsL
MYFAALYSATATAALDPTDVIRIEASAGFLHDNNLFRLPNEVDPKLFNIDHPSDTAWILGLGLTFDKMISRQRLLAELNLNNYKYDKNTFLDNTGGTGRAAWFWQVGNLWSGEASYRRKRELGGFEDVRFLDISRRAVKDTIDTDVYTFAGRYQFHPRWRVGAELQDLEVSHRIRRELDYDAQVIVADLRYRTPGENTIGVEWRETDRSYPNRITVGPFPIDNGHTETRLNAIALWQFTGALKLDAELGHAEVKHDTQSQRNFSGATWKAGATWEATGKLSFKVSTFRDLRLYEDNLASFQVVDGIGFTPIYAITSKIVLRGDFTFEKRDYRGEPGFLPINVNREDDVRMSRIGVIYTPIRNIDLALTYERGDRRSSSTLPNPSLNDFNYNSWFGTLKIGF